MKKKIIIALSLLLIVIAISIPCCKELKEKAQKAQTNIEEIQEQNDTSENNN
jgi:hypothetical protein